MSVQEVIQKLKLKPHPEGGHYSETYRSERRLSDENGNERNLCTSIYFLLAGNEKSSFHKIKSDELWYFHQGEALELFYIQDSRLHVVTLGNNLFKDELSFFRVPANTWFASCIKSGQGFSLVSCVVAPGFDFEDFELATQSELMREFPELKDIIVRFT